jgi:hypothetical protein
VRLLQRAPNVDLRSAVFMAANSFLAANADAVRPQIGTDTSVYLPAGPGAFAATVIGARTPDNRHYIYARARTWLRANMLGPDQTFLPKAQTAEDAVALALWRWAEVGIGATTG